MIIMLQLFKYHFTLSRIILALSYRWEGKKASFVFKQNTHTQVLFHVELHKMQHITSSKQQFIKKKKMSAEQRGKVRSIASQQEYWYWVLSDDLQKPRVIPVF